MVIKVLVIADSPVASATAERDEQCRPDGLKALKCFGEAFHSVVAARRLRTSRSHVRRGRGAAASKTIPEGP